MPGETGTGASAIGCYGVAIVTCIRCGPHLATAQRQQSRKIATSPGTPDHRAITVVKLASDPTIVHGLVVLVLFTADATTADHDLDVWRSRARERGLHLWPPAQRSFPISDRLGNRLCTVALFPVDPS